MEVIKQKTIYRVNIDGVPKDFFDREKACAVERNAKYSGMLANALKNVCRETFGCSKFNADGVVQEFSGTIVEDNSYCCVGPASYTRTVRFNTRDVIQENKYKLKNMYEKLSACDITWLPEETRATINDYLDMFKWMVKTYRIEL